jgi:hypothetical protein
MRHKSLFPFIIIFIISIPLITIGSSNDNKGIEIIYKNAKGIEKPFVYSKSYALLIGVSDYINDNKGEWEDLKEIPEELSRVKKALEHQGFQVEEVMNPDSKELKATFEDFINNYGYNEHNRLLFFYSGHGHSRNNEGYFNKGYIVPVDAPVPQKNEKGFARKALDMDQILTWSRKIEAKHAMFLFDSCFSGTIFQHKKSLPLQPYIYDANNHYVRTFITAGSAEQVVPAKSIFVPVFIRALAGEADGDKDGYVCDYELAPFIYQEVQMYNPNQTPQFERHGDPNSPGSKKGSFVFVSDKHMQEDKKEIRRMEETRQLLHMTRRYNNCMLIDKSNLKETEKVKILEGFIRDYSRNNPYSIEDDKMREYVAKRIDFWKVENREPTLRSHQLHNLLTFDRKNLPYIDHIYEEKAIKYDDIVIDHTTRLMWQRSGSPKPMRWKEAKRWVSELNDRGYVSYNDWRLPTVEEAASLLESSKRNGILIDRVFDNRQKRIWTCDKKSPIESWYVDFKGNLFFGPVVSGNDSKRISVRAVRTME